MYVDLSFPIEDGMATLPGVLPEASVGAYKDHQASRDRYQGKAEFYLGRFDMAGNVGTYLDAPFHRFREGGDLSTFELEQVAGLPGVVVDASAEFAPVTIDLPAEQLRGKALLIRTGWDSRWPGDDYWREDPFVSAETTEELVQAGVALVGVDFSNVDDTTDPVRPAHTGLLEAGIPIVEHLRGLDALPRDGFRFYAVAPRVVGGASFPVRAFAEAPG
jgi:kynurenine formamidase